MAASDPHPLRLLFICSRNRWRSPTAEAIYRRHPGVAARSAGTSRAAARTVRVDDVRWADVIILMEDEHQRRLVEEFGEELRGKDLRVLGIPDDYRRMDPELIALLRESIDPIIDGFRPA